MPFGNVKKVKSSKGHTTLPIGSTARIAQSLLSREPVNHAELEDCARLDEALARAHRLLKATVRGIMLSRLKRTNRARGRR